MSNNIHDINDNTVRTAAQMVEAILAQKTPEPTADEKAKELALKIIRGDFLGELAMFKDAHLLAFMNVLREGITNNIPMHLALEKFAEEAEALQLDKAGWTLSFMKVCRARLEGQKGGVRL